MGNLLSMTGYAQAASKLLPEIVVELKTVNSRFLDINCKLPSGAEKFEPVIQKLIRSKLSRGRVEVLLKREAERVQTSGFNFNSAQFNSAVENIVGQLKLQGLDQKEQIKLVASVLLERKEFLSFDQVDLNFLLSEEAVLDALQGAINSLVAMRTNEGANLKKVLEDNLSRIKQFPEKVLSLIAAAKDKYTARLKNKISELELSVPEERIALEVALVVDRSDVTEELDRLASHVRQFEELLVSGGEVGKKLDFLTQEMNREINTTGSKSQSGDISNLVIEAKSVLEKIREQVQNIE